MAGMISMYRRASPMRVSNLELVTETLMTKSSTTGTMMKMSGSTAMVRMTNRLRR